MSRCATSRTSRRAAPRSWASKWPASGPAIGASAVTLTLLLRPAVDAGERANMAGRVDGLGPRFRRFQAADPRARAVLASIHAMTFVPFPKPPWRQSFVLKEANAELTAGRY